MWNRPCVCRCRQEAIRRSCAPKAAAQVWRSSSFTICVTDGFRAVLLEPTDLHKALDGVFAGDDADEVSLGIDDGGETEAGGAEALDDSVGGFGVARGDDAAHVTGERFAARLFQQNIEGVYQADGFAFFR